MYVIVYQKHSRHPLVFTFPNLTFAENHFCDLAEKTAKNRGEWEEYEEDLERDLEDRFAEFDNETFGRETIYLIEATKINHYA